MSRRRSSRLPPARRPSSTGPTLGRLWLFRIVTAVAVPVLLVGLIEVGLRIAGVGFRPGFTVGCQVQGRDALCENPEFSQQFFPAAVARRPTSFVIPAVKAPRTFRIFIVGESAAQGDPEPTFGFGRFLQAMLRERFPDFRFEVINTGVVAINSHALLPIARDIARHDADVVIVYAGNNEVVGPYGNGTVFTRRQPSLAMIRASIALRSTRIGQLLSTGLVPRGQNADLKIWRGMEMFLGQQLRANDPSMSTMYQNFQTNLLDIVAVARRGGARVIVSTVGTRLRGLAPFASLHRPNLTPAELDRWQVDQARGTSLESESRWNEALAAYRAAATVDGDHAELQYRMARCLWMLGDPRAARAHFIRARDLDTLRFRADTRINDIIRSIGRASDPGVKLVDGAAALEQASAGGVPGGELFYDHAHPTPAGNYLLARALFPAVVAALPALVHGSTAPVEPPSEEECVRRLALTGFDRYRVAKEVLRRLARPPFTHQLDHREQVQEMEGERDRGAKETFEETDAAYRAALQEDGSDPWVHYNYGVLLDTRDVFLARRGEADAGRAIGQYARALEQVPQFADGRIRLAEAFIRLGRLDDAIAQCRELLRIRPRYGPAYRTMAFALNRKNLTPEAIAAYRLAIALDPTFSTVHLELGSLLAARGDGAGAAEHFGRAVDLSPEDPDAQRSLVKILAAQGRLDDAIRSAHAGADRLREAGRGSEADALLEAARQLEAKRRP